MKKKMMLLVWMLLSAITVMPVSGAELQADMQPDAPYAPGEVLVFINKEYSRKETEYTPELFPETEVSTVEYVNLLYYSEGIFEDSVSEDRISYDQQVLKLMLADADADVDAAAARLEMNEMVDTAMPNYDFFTNGRPDAEEETSDIQMEYDEVHGIVYLYGTGAIPANYWFGGSDSPFSRYDVNKLVISEGITYISDYAFSDLFPAESSYVNEQLHIILPDSLQGMGVNAFAGIADRNKHHIGAFTLQPSTITVYASEGTVGHLFAQVMDAELVPKISYVDMTGYLTYYCSTDMTAVVGLRGTENMALDLEITCTQLDETANREDPLFAQIPTDYDIRRYRITFKKDGEDWMPPEGSVECIRLDYPETMIGKGMYCYRVSEDGASLENMAGYQTSIRLPEEIGICGTIWRDIGLKQTSVGEYIIVAPHLYGDLNRNNGVDADDALTVLKCVVGLKSLSEPMKITADVDGDGVVTTEDALWILKKVVHITYFMPAEPRC